METGAAAWIERDLGTMTMARTSVLTVEETEQRKCVVYGYSGRERDR